MLENVCRLLKQRKLAIFTGAGISIDPPSSIPGWQQLINAMVHALTTHHSDLKGLDDDIVAANIAPEVISQILYESIGEEYLSTFEVLKNRKPNHHHIYLAKLAKSGFASFFVTANLDTCLEDAMESEGMERDKDYFVYATESDFERFMDFPQYSGVRIFKIHGSVENLHSIITTFSKEGQGLSKNKIRLLRCLLLIRHFLFIGYSGNDLNANPNYIMLEDLAMQAKGFYWNFLPHENVHKQVERLMELYDKRSDTLQFSGVDLLQKLWEYVDGESFAVVEKKDEGFDYAAELQKWCAAPEVAGGVYYALGALLRHVAQNDKAIQCYHKAIEHYRDKNNVDKLCQATCDLGGLLHFQGKDSEAEKVYKDLLQEFSEQQTAEKAFIYEGLANLALDNGSIEKSKEYYMQALEILEESAHFSGTAHLFIRLGNFYKSQGEWQLARNYYQQSMVLAEEIWSYKLLVDVYSRLGDLELHQGKWSAAENNYKKGIKIAEGTAYELGCADLYNAPMLSSIYRKIATLHQQKKEWESAQNFIKKALEVSQEKNLQMELADNYRTCGLIHADQNKLSEALKELNSSLQIYQEKNNLAQIAQSYRLIANIHRRKEDWDIAKEFYLDAIKIQQQIKDKTSLAHTHVQMGHLYREQGLIEESENAFVAAKDIYEHTQNKRKLMDTLAHIGNLMVKCKNFNVALQNYRQSLKIAKELGDELEIANAQFNLSFILRKSGNIEEAIRLLEKSSQVYEKRQKTANLRKAQKMLEMWKNKKK